MISLENVQKILGNKFYFEAVDNNTYQIFAPLFHEDGDMMSIYITKEADSNNYIIRDFGNTLMRLSYSFDLNTSNKKNVLNNIIIQNRGDLIDDEIIINCKESYLPDAILQYSQIVSKVSNMDILNRNNVSNLFYDYLNEYVEKHLSKFTPNKKVQPIRNRSDLVVDWAFPKTKKGDDLFLFGVKDNSKAKDVTICCLEFKQIHLPFKSIIVYENMDDISQKEKFRLTNIADKQFTSLDSFMDQAQEYLKTA